MTIEELQSKTIDWLRFPMIIGVLLIHSYKPPINKGGMILGNDQLIYPVFQFLRNLGSEVVARLSVPMFFLFAGYLFFQATRFDKPFYVKKLNSRFHSLLIPYLFWNAFAILTFAFLQQVLGLYSLAYGPVPLVAKWDIMDYFRCFWDFRPPHYPLVYPLWFIRDLMITMLLSPLFYLLLKRLKRAAMLMFFLFWITGLSVHFTGINTMGIFFFMLGGSLRLSRRNMVTECRKFFRFSLIAYPILAVSDALTKGLFFNSYIHNAGILIGVLFLINAVSWLLDHKKIAVGTFLPGASFFLFAAHEQSLSQIRKSLTALFPPGTLFCDVMLYVLPLLILIPLVLSVYYLLKKHFPSILRIMVGAR
ncbi:MAG: acyltransferase family protein [Bacteroides sp.]|uniref:acyltransferase family protein n=1 Tax=Bacteroides sp. TaxID=29523 RepID=UPI002FC9EE86